MSTGGVLSSFTRLTNIPRAAGVAEPWATEVDGEPVFVKHAYDAFLSGDASAQLRARLEATGTRRLYVAGALTKACVMFTCNSAFTLGYEVCVVADCCADRSREHHDAVLGVYDGYHIRVVQSGEVFVDGASPGG